MEYKFMEVRLYLYQKTKQKKVDANCLEID